MMANMINFLDGTGVAVLVSAVVLSSYQLVSEGEGFGYSLVMCTAVLWKSRLTTVDVLGLGLSVKPVEVSTPDELTADVIPVRVSVVNSVASLAVEAFLTVPVVLLSGAVLVAAVSVTVPVAILVAASLTVVLLSVTVLAVVSPTIVLLSVIIVFVVIAVVLDSLSTLEDVLEAVVLVLSVLLVGVPLVVDSVLLTSVDGLVVDSVAVEVLVVLVFLLVVEVVDGMLVLKWPVVVRPE